MNKIYKTYKLILIWLFLFFPIITIAQSRKQKALERKRIEVIKEIEKINKILKSNQSTSKSVMGKLEDVNLKIRSSENLIKITNQQANLLSKDIKENSTQIENLNLDLDLLKSDYAKMVVKSYQSRSKQSKLMFLFSSDNFLQAYKRYNYMQQYKRYQEKKADSIASKTELLVNLNQELEQQKSSKERLLRESKKERELLQKEKRNQQDLIRQIKQDDAKYRAIVLKKQKESEALDRQIDKMINDFIARSNRKAGKGSTKTFALTPEAKALAENFSSNKGKLPWPVKTGTVTRRFGKKAHPVLPGIVTNSSGVDITTSSGAIAKVCFDGVVSKIEKYQGGAIAIYVRHGDYITLYYNIREVYVKKGQNVKTNQKLGKILTNTDGKTVLKFKLFKNKTKLNPAHWIYKM